MFVFATEVIPVACHYTECLGTVLAGKFPVDLNLIWLRSFADCVVLEIRLLMDLSRKLAFGRLLSGSCPCGLRYNLWRLTSVKRHIITIMLTDNYVHVITTCISQITVITYSGGK